MGDLRALIEAVEAREVRMNQCASAFPSESAGGLCTWHRVWAAYNGSLDAAMALHEALLGYDWGIASFSLNGEVSVKRNRPLDVQYGFADMDPARAWLLAILRAKEAGQ